MNLLHDKLTARERQIIKGMCSGQTFEEIAAIMRDVAPHSVSSAASRMYPKIGARNAIEAAYKWGCAEVREPSKIDLDAVMAEIARLAGKVVLKRIA